MPAGVWSYRLSDEPLNFFAPSSAAARAGAKGLRNVDVTSGAAFVAANGLARSSDPDGGTFDQFWFRGTRHNLVGETKIVRVDLLRK